MKRKYLFLIFFSLLLFSSSFSIFAGDWYDCRPQDLKIEIRKETISKLEKIILNKLERDKRIKGQNINKTVGTLYLSCLKDGAYIEVLRLVSYQSLDTSKDALKFLSRQLLQHQLNFDAYVSQIKSLIDEGKLAEKDIAINFHGRIAQDIEDYSSYLKLSEVNNSVSLSTTLEQFEAIKDFFENSRKEYERQKGKLEEIVQVSSKVEEDYTLLCKNFTTVTKSFNEGGDLPSIIKELSDIYEKYTTREAHLIDQEKKLKEIDENLNKFDSALTIINNKIDELNAKSLKKPKIFRKHQ